MEGLRTSANKRDEELNAVKAEVQKLKDEDTPKLQGEVKGLQTQLVSDLLELQTSLEAKWTGELNEAKLGLQKSIMDA